MNQKKVFQKVFLIVLFLVSAFLLLRGCGVGKKEKKLLKRVEVQNWEVEETTIGTILNATVKMPDYEKLLIESYEKAQKGLFSSEKKFEKKLYKLVEKKAKKEKKLVEKQITVNLSLLDEKVKVKSRKKMEKFIKEYALEQEFEKLCVEILSEGFREMMYKEAVE